jgi:hypothetical protein
MDRNLQSRPRAGAASGRRDSGPDLLSGRRAVEVGTVLSERAENTNRLVCGQRPPPASVIASWVTEGLA